MKSEDLKSKVINTIDSLIPKGYNSLSLPEMYIAYGINKAKEAVEKLFAESSTQLNDSNVLDCVSRQAVLNYIDNMPSELTADGRRMIRRIRLTEYIQDSLPSVEPKRKTGRWQEDTSGYGFWICSNCGFVSEASGANILYNFCPHCGAEMKGEEDESVN